MQLQMLRKLDAPVWLRSAADILESRGWIQGVSVHARSGRVDAFGALGLAMGCSLPDLSGGTGMIFAGVPKVRRALLVEIVEAASAKLNEDISAWNDRPERTMDEVVEFFRSFAAEIEGA